MPVIRFPARSDAPAHAGLEEIIHVMQLCQLQQLLPMGSDQGFVGGHHVFPGQNGPAGKLQRDAAAADGLHHHPDIGIPLHHGKIPDDHGGKGTIGKIPDIYDILQPYGFPGGGVDLLPVPCQHTGHTGAYDPEAENCD